MTVATVRDVAPETPPLAPSRPPRAERHVRALDGIRGIAIILVLCRHIGEDGPARRAGGVVAAALNAGWLGVDVFFVLSGFLITGILLDARGDDSAPARGYFRNFYARRALRIFPAYYLFLAIVFLIGRPNAPYGTWWYWTYLANALVARHGWPDGPWEIGHLWSLAVEEQFYLVWPAIIAWTPRKRLPALCLMIIVAAMAMRLVLLHQGAPRAAYVMMPARADTLAIGAALAVLLRNGVKVPVRGITVITLGVLGVLFVTHQLDHRFIIGGLVIGSVATALLTAACIARVTEGGRVRRVLEWGPLVSFGTYSYAIYLVQLPIRGAIDYWLGDRIGTWPAMAGVAADAILLTSVSWGIAWVSWRVFERPILSLKRFVPMPSRGTTRLA